jgi:hypothetical protein
MVKRKSTAAILAVRFGENAAFDCVICGPPVIQARGVGLAISGDHGLDTVDREGVCDEMLPMSTSHEAGGRTAVQPIPIRTPAARAQRP